VRVTRPAEAHVLVVDDDDGIREMLQSSLTFAGFRVTTAPDAQSALGVFGVDDPDAVVLDVMMPGIDGPTTLGRLRGPLPPAVPAIFLTAKLQPADRARLKALGAAGVIAKPFDPMLLSAELDRILAAQG
jgi:DNA-binding response OmpR family regulator